MPNHVTTICTVRGPGGDLERFHNAHIGPKGLDFETVIPTPECIKDTPSDSMTELAMMAILSERANAGVSFAMYGVTRDIVSGPGYKHGEQVLRWLEERHPEAIANARRAFAALAETGYANWYTWKVANWGTKWNAYDFESRERGDGVYVFKFETAWSFPEPIFRRLAATYPFLTFEIVSYDEGSNFACVGSFNGANDYAVVEATDELFERVYGHPREREDDT